MAGEQADRQVACVVLEALLLPVGEQALVGVVEQPVGPTAAQDAMQNLLIDSYLLELFR